MITSESDTFWTTIQLHILVAAVRAFHHGHGTTPQPPIALSPQLLHIATYAAAHQPASDTPSFGGVHGDDGSAAGKRPREPRSPPSQRRLWVLALLYANPLTPCTVPQVAHVFGLRESDVRSARPNTARKVGRAMMAPFGHWLVELQHAGLVPVWRPEYDPPQPSPTRSTLPSPRTNHLRPLGGPTGT